MASSATISAVDARVATYWAVTDPETTLAVPYLGLNVQGEPPENGGAYLAIDYPVSTSEQISVGAPGAQLYRESGGIRFVLAIPRGVALNWWLTQLETLVAHFRSVNFSGVRTYAPAPPIIDDSADQAGYWRLISVVPYYRDVLG